MNADREMDEGFSAFEVSCDSEASISFYALVGSLRLKRFSHHDDTAHSR
jgi:hypothetical protein